MRIFEPHPQIALCKSQFNPEIHKTHYKFNYRKLEEDIKNGKLDRLKVYRTLILEDLWFMLYFVMGVPDTAKPNHPFVVARCNELQEDDGNFTLDVWAREHYKSTLKTIGKGIQRILKYPERSNAIFSHKASVSKQNFLFEIKQHLENSELLQQCFSDCLWSNPQKEAPMWSLDGGLVLRRKTNRKEATISAHGLIEGMPTGLHFDFMDFDDIVTQDVADSHDQMEKIKDKFDIAMNLGTDGGGHTVTGTFYHFNDPLKYIRDKRNPLTGERAYKLRFYPSTEDGRPDGKPVFNSEEREAQLRLTKSYRTQQLCDPMPESFATLKPEYLNYIGKDKLPKRLFKFIVVDQAGDADNQRGGGDDWAIVTFGVNPVLSEIGASEIYILDIFSEPLGESEGIDLITQKYIEAGMVMALGIEKVGISSTHNQIQALLKQRGRYLTIERDIKKKRSSIILLLTPPNLGAGKGNNKKKFIESAIEWSLNNGKINVLDTIPAKYKDKLELEMKQHPYGKSDDILNTIAYLMKDIVLQYNFPVDSGNWKPAYGRVRTGGWMTG